MSVRIQAQPFLQDKGGEGGPAFVLMSPRLVKGRL